MALFKIRAFTSGNIASLLGAIARGGLQFMLVIWLAGIWLPLHGYNFEVTPLWAGIYMLPLTAGFLIAGPVSGILSDRYGARPFATAGLLVGAAAFAGLLLLPIDFPYWAFALIILCNGLGSGLFASPNTSSIMSSVPARHRGAASGMRSVFQNSGMSLSIGIFFSLMIAGLASTLPKTLSKGLESHGVPAAAAVHVANLPPVSTLFSALLGYNPIAGLLGPTGALKQLSPHNLAVLTGHQFFPHLIAQPFQHGLRIVFTAAIIMSLAGALISLMRGRQFIYAEPGDDGAALSPAGRGALAPAAGGALPRASVPSSAGRGPAGAPATELPAEAEQGDALADGDLPVAD
jgi:MFS family permease